MKRLPSRYNCLLAVYKPAGMSSHDCINTLRRALGERRIGHAGTLDPLAQGLLVCGVGVATRLLPYVTARQKTYLADICFGCETTTDDAEGTPTKSAAPHAQLTNPDYAQRILAQFLGDIQQVPPIYSAISKNGVRSYNAARNGVAFELEARPVHVYSAELVRITTPDSSTTDSSTTTDSPAQPVWRVRFCVSKGTYIRSLARDIGRCANSAAHLSFLERTSSGALDTSCALTLSELEACAHAEAACASDSRHAHEPMQEFLASHMVNPLVAASLTRYNVTDCEHAAMERGIPFAARSCGFAACIDDRAADAAAAAEQAAGDVHYVGCVQHSTLYGVYRYNDGMLTCAVNVLQGIDGAGV